jgi:tRNA 2-thiocytidine biosynthesis protein TtcA
LFAGQLATMPPKLLADDGANVVIRPLVYCAEEDIRAFAQLAGFPILPCDLCGSQEQLQRKVVGRLIDDLDRQRPGTKAVMLAALQNVRPTHLLDRRLWSALGIHAAAEDEEEPSDRPLIGERRLIRVPEPG